MEYVKTSPEVMNCLNEMTDLAEKILLRMHLSKNPEITPIDFFLFFFQQRAVKIGRSISLLTENQLYQDAWAIARIATEGLYFIKKFELDPSLANKWNSFYILSKYREEYDEHERKGKHGKEAAEKLLARFAPEIVKNARDEFGDAFENRKKNPKWFGYRSVYDLVKDLAEKKVIDDEDYKMFYGTFSEAVHWTPLALIDAEMYLGAVIGKAFLFILEMSTTVNSEFLFGFEHEIAHIQHNFIECMPQGK